ncbi:hypothetical protein P9166_12500 [Lactococcus lactis]|nr:hypothetical protein P9166_12500 [Lactococcus lactis]
MTNWITEVQDNDYVSNRASGIIANQMAAQSIESAGFQNCTIQGCIVQNYVK